MKAVVAHAFGPPEGMVLEEQAGRPPGPGEVRVRLAWAGVSFVDALVAAGRHQHVPALPFVPGSEFSGEVIDVGAGVVDVGPGDRVCGGNMGGVLAQEVTLPAGRVQTLPASVCMRQAAVLRASYLTAWYGLVERGAVAAGETVLVLGAAGAVGIAACQIATWCGAHVIAAASSHEKRRFALQNGASHAIDPAAADWRERIMTLTGGRGPDVVVDPVGGDMTERALRSIACKGRHLIIGFAAGSIPRLPANLPLLRGASVVGVLVSHFVDREPQAAAGVRARLLELFAAGVLRPVIGEVFPLEQYALAFTAAAAGRTLGRVLLDMS